MGRTSIAAEDRQKYQPAWDLRVIVPNGGQADDPTNHTGAIQSADSMVRPRAGNVPPVGTTDIGQEQGRNGCTMAGRARRETRGQGRSSRAASSWPVLAAASVGASGSDTVTTSPGPSQDPTPPLPTRATYRNLISRGLAPDEAANLTAYLAGIGVGGSRWTLAQINQLLFLRQMNRSGHFAEPIDRLH